MRREAPVLHVRFSRGDLLRRAAILAGAASYVALLACSYAFHISPAYAYLGYTLAPAPPAVLVLAFMAAWLPALWVPVRLTRPSQVVYWMLFLLVYVPSAFIPFMAYGTAPLGQLPLLGVLVVAFASVAAIYRLPRLVLPRVRVVPGLYWTLLAIVVAALGALVISRLGVRLEIPSLLDVYDVREEFKAAEPSRAVSYGVSWLGNILLPFVIATGLIKRMPVLVLMGIAGQLVIFSLTGFKSVLLSSALLVLLLVALGNDGRRFGTLAVWGSAVLVASSWLLDALANTFVFSSFLVRRLIVTPGILTGWYHEFFSEHPKAHLGHSVLEGFTAYPYDVVPPLLIGREYFGRAETYANANLWADAYANFGYAGIVGFTLVLMIVLWLFDSLVRGRDWRQVKLAALLLGVPAFTLSNTALITSLLTHGAALAWLVLYLLPRGALVRALRPRRRHAPGRGHERPA